MATQIQRGLRALAELRELCKLGNLGPVVLKQFLRLLDVHESEVDTRLRTLDREIKALRARVIDYERIQEELKKKDEWGLWNPNVFKKEILPEFIQSVITDRRDLEEWEIQSAALASSPSISHSSRSRRSVMTD